MNLIIVRQPPIYPIPYFENWPHFNGVDFFGRIHHRSMIKHAETMARGQVYRDVYRKLGIVFYQKSFSCHLGAGKWPDCSWMLITTRTSTHNPTNPPPTPPIFWWAKKNLSHHLPRDHWNSLCGFFSSQPSLLLASSMEWHCNLQRILGFTGEICSIADKPSMGRTVRYIYRSMNGWFLW